jgi:SAM-dependent methyltransferase
MADAPPRTTAYVPALGFAALTRLYDPILRATVREGAFKRALVAQAAPAPRMRILDLGAGTGTLTLMLQRNAPAADVIGVDGDAEILTLARAKAAAAEQPVRFDQALAFALPYPNGVFDRVVSSLLFHHLSPADKRRTLREVFRVLAPGGELHVADWGRPRNAVMRALFLGVQVLDGFATTAENVAGMLPELFREAGFTDVHETTTFATIYGTLALYRATRPQESAPLVSTS